MNVIRTLVVSAVSLAVGGCCCVGGGGHAKPGEAVKSSAKVMADPGRLHAVHKVALVSVTAPCDVTDESFEGRSRGEDKSVFGAVYAAKTMKNVDYTRAPASLNEGLPTFQQQLAATTGWTMLPMDEIVGNPKYATLTFDPDLHAQVRETRKAFCTGLNYRILTADYTPRAGELAAALGVDAVVLVQTQLSIRNWNDRGTVTKGFWSVAVDGFMTVVGPDGMTLYQGSIKDIRQDKFVGFDDEHHAAVEVLTGVAWNKVPHNAVSALRNAATAFGEDYKKAVAAAPAASAPAPATTAAPISTPGPVSTPGPKATPAPH